MKNAIIRKMHDGTFTASIYDETGACVAEHSDFTTEARAAEYASRYTDTDTEEEEEEETMRNNFTPAEAAMHAATVRGIIRRKGGYRERDILNRPHAVERGETWNEAHKVVNVLEVEPQADGYRAGFAVDLVTRSIVG